MIQQFFSSLGEISPILPWLVRTLIVIVVATVVWVILSVPAFWLCRAIGYYIRSGLSALSELVRALLNRSWQLFVGCMGPINEFVAAHAQMFSFAHENYQIRADIEKLRVAVEAIPSRIASLELSVNDAEKKFSSASETLSQFETPPPIQAPGSQDFAAVQIVRNRAVVKLIVALIFAPVLIGFNTGMLNEFFSSFWTDIQLFDAVPLSIVIALLATVLELALGAFIVLFPNRVAQLALMICVALLAFVEASFYARLGQEFQWSLFDAFYPPGAAPAWTKLWLLVFGPVLVVGLAFTGHALFESISQLADSHVIRQWRKYVATRMSKATELKQRLGDADRAKTLLNSSLVDVQTNFSTTKGVAGSSLAVIEGSKDIFLQQIKLAAQVRLEDSRRLDRGAMLRQFFECLIFALAALIAIGLVAFVYTFFPVPLALHWFSGFGFGWTVALSEAVILLIAGSAAARANTTLPAADGIPATNPPHSVLGPFIGVSILVAVIGGNAFYTLQVITSFNVMLWALLIAANVALFWCGMRLGMIAAAVWALVCALAYVAASAAVAAAAALTGVVWLGLGLLFILLVALAYPYCFVFLRDPTGSQILPKAAV